MEYLDQQGVVDDIRSREEYLLELLSFGLLWKSYAAYALNVTNAPLGLLSNLAEWRKKFQNAKPYIDVVRGILITLFLFPRIENKSPVLKPMLKDIDRFCRWLSATGEFNEQSIRFQIWRPYWVSMPTARWIEGRDKVFRVVDWFKQRSQEVLGRYTENVDGFLVESAKTYRWREDRVQCMRNRTEYHLNMVGAEMMNRAFRPDFKNTESTALLIPGCMRSPDVSECKAVVSPKGLLCKGCNKTCHANQLRLMGLRNNFETYIIPHSSDLSRWAPVPGQPRNGVIAVACVTTLLEGGWELKRYGVCAQCVLLNFSGCKKHWHKEGIPTSINIGELKRVLKRNGEN